MTRHDDADRRDEAMEEAPDRTATAGRRRLVALALSLPLALTLAMAASAAHAARAHAHGEATLDVAVEGDGFAVSLRVPMESLTGFEHRPRTAAERRAAQDALAVLRQPATWLRADAAAGCTVAAADVEADPGGWLSPPPPAPPAVNAVTPRDAGARATPSPGMAPGARIAVGAGKKAVDDQAGDHGDGHADVQVDARFRCRVPTALRGAEATLFDAFARLQRLTVQVAGPHGQAGQTLTRAARRLVLAR